MKLTLAALFLGGLTLAGFTLRAAPAAPAPAPAGGPVTFDAETVGGPSASFEGVIGDWYVGEADGKRGLMVDGTRWRQGTPSANLADQAKRLYGDRYAEFLDGVKAFAFFPLAIWKNECAAARHFSVRFYPIAGRIDQGAGIAFDVGTDGSYYGFRANALENNMLFFKVVKGKRSILQTIRGVSTSTRTWHTLTGTIAGKELTVDLDGKERFKRALDREPTGRCGLWSKADSKVLFDDFEAKP
jgi:hypothetical protein